MEHLFLYKTRNIIMKRYILILMILLSCVILPQVKVSDVPAVTIMNEADFFMLIQGTINKKITVTTFQNQFNLSGGRIINGSITLNKLSQNVIDYIGTAGGGTVTNYPDDMTIQSNANSTLSLLGTV